MAHRSRPGRGVAGAGLEHLGLASRGAALALAAFAGLLVPAAAPAGDWTDLNPGGGGAFTAIGAGPTGTIICGSDLSGAYRSRDRGLTWDAIGFNRGLERTHVSAIGFDPADPQVIHLGSEIGIYRSGDGGDSFQQVLATGYIGAVTPARSNPDVVYAAHHAAYNTVASDIYRSVDRGRTWSALESNLPAGLRILKLLVSTTDPGTLYMVSGADLFVAGSEALFRSTDGGASWSRIGAALGNIWDLAMDSATPSTLYVTVYQGTPRSSWSGCVYKSTDGGDTWSRKATHTGAILVKRDQPQVVRVVDVDRGSTHPEGGVWESLDGGDTWRKKSTMAGWDPGWMAVNWAYDAGAYGVARTLGEDLSDPDVILWADWYFAFASFDGGLDFQNLCATEVAPGRWRSRGINNVTLASLAISEADPNRIYTGYHDIGMWRSLDGGAGWQACNSAALTGSWRGNGGNTSSIVADPTRPTVVWASNGGTVDKASLAKSADSGAPDSWMAARGLPVGFVKGLSLSRVSPDTMRTLYVTANGDVYRSQDDGATWSLAFDCNGCRSTAVDRFDGTLVYAGGEAGLWRSRAGGAPGTWVAIGPPEMAGRNPRPVKDEQWNGVHQIAPDPRQSGRVFVTAYGKGRGLYRSADAGASWTRLRDSAFMRGVATDPTNSDVIYATSSAACKSGGTATSGSEGILRSITGGQTWISIADGLAWPFGGPVAIDPANPLRVILGSSGAGFFARTLAPPGP